MLLQSAALCLHAFDFAGDSPSRNTIYLMNNLISYAMLACLFAGLVGSWIVKKNGNQQTRAAGLTRTVA